MPYIVVACPARLADLIEQGRCRPCDVEVTVLDEDPARPPYPAGPVATAGTAGANRSQQSVLHARRPIPGSLT